MTANQPRVVLFANGELPEPDRVKQTLAADDYFIAVDGGLQHLMDLNLTPRLIIGDLDSAKPEDIRRFLSQGVTVRQYPIDKNETDLELALQAALEQDPGEVRIVAALGGRLDQTLGNIFLLTQPGLTGVDLRLIDGVQEVFLIRSTATLHGQPGQRVSLLPLQGEVAGVETFGLAYPLNNETLYPDKTRGISNRMAAPDAEVRIASGLLLCIHETSEPEERE